MESWLKEPVLIYQRIIYLLSILINGAMKRGLHDDVYHYNKLLNKINS